jgi:hypothetical protein
MMTTGFCDEENLSPDKPRLIGQAHKLGKGGICRDISGRSAAQRKAKAGGSHR